LWGRQNTILHGGGGGTIVKKEKGTSGRKSKKKSEYSTIGSWPRNRFDRSSKSKRATKGARRPGACKKKKKRKRIHKRKSANQTSISAAPQNTHTGHVEKWEKKQSASGWQVGSGGHLTPPLGKQKERKTLEREKISGGRSQRARGGKYGTVRPSAKTSVRKKRMGSRHAATPHKGTPVGL